MIDTLTQLWDAYVAFRTASVDVYMSIGPLGLLGVGAGSALLNFLLNQPSGAEEAALASGTAASDAQAQELQRIVHHVAPLQRVDAVGRNRQLFCAESKFEKGPGRTRSLKFQQPASTMHGHLPR